ncbi:unnamed protein product [Didymodactylos carnosus]|nr:unnamed protein product [Didymodactylos carnosus]CAF3697435.1 unnamed protein product [Didymodactylos carnosus]
MTTIEFGGGPTLKARRQFANLKEGSHVPKYTGHIHQIRFRQGHTYGEQTHQLYKEYPQLSRSKSDLPISEKRQLQEQKALEDPYETHEFPDGLLPGYTGYVPQRKFQHGDRYRVETDECLVNSKKEYDDAKQKINDLQRTIASYPKPLSLNNDRTVKHFLDYHRAYHPNEISTTSDRRLLTEPPIPGYQGYIPRIRPTELGLGARYHETTRKGLNRFALETQHSMTNWPISLADTNNSTADPNLQDSTSDLRMQTPRISSANRLYVKPGMIPKYTGYLPQRKYHIGHTYGDTTRSLPVCSHSFSNYADFIRSKTFIESVDHNKTTADIY